MTQLAIGDAVPEFALKDQHGQSVTSQSLLGRPVLILFFPWAFSGICHGELCEIRDGIGAFEGAEVVGISCDASFSLRAWADQEGFDFPLLSDFWPHGEVARAFGVFDSEVGVSLRGSFLLDAQGIVRWTTVNGIGEARQFSDYTSALAQIAI